MTRPRLWCCPAPIFRGCSCAASCSMADRSPVFAAIVLQSCLILRSRVGMSNALSAIGPPGAEAERVVGACGVINLQPLRAYLLYPRSRCAAPASRLRGAPSDSELGRSLHAAVTWGVLSNARHHARWPLSQAGQKRLLLQCWPLSQAGSKRPRRGGLPRASPCPRGPGKS